MVQRVITRLDGASNAVAREIKAHATAINTLVAGTIPGIDIDAGSNAVAGSVDIFPAGSSLGKLSIVAANSAGNTTTTITNASQAGARTYTIPDAGASSSFVMLAGTSAITGVKTMSGANVITHAPTGLKIQDSDASHLVTIAPGDESADRTLSIPVLGAADIVMTLGTAQAVSGVKTASTKQVFSAGLNTKQAVTNVNDTTPTDAELQTAFGGTAASLGRGFIGTIDDNDGNAIGYIVWTSDASFYFVIGTKAT